MNIIGIDNADHLIACADAGTHGGTAWTRPSTVPSSSATLLVSNHVYNAAGWLQDTIDPMGIDTRTNYDNLGRVTQTIQDYTNGTETAESNISTEYGYDGNDNVTFVQADEPGGSYQKTAYVYGVTTAGGSGVNSNDILSAVQYPDPSTGNPSSGQQDSYLVNALGDVAKATDRNGNVHQYSYDVLGRLTSDAVTTLGAGVDGTVRRIDYAYDSQGNNYLITSYDAASGGNIVNQVQRVFNGLGQLTGEYQSHSGAVVQGTTPEVQYAYTEMSGGQNNSRLTSMTYPSNYVLNYNYNTGLDSNISRLSSISDSGGTLESYKYLGLDTVVEWDHPQNNVNLNYIKQSADTQYNSDGGDQYTGLDRFGRAIDQNWINGTTGTSTDRFQYGYDQDSDVLYRQNLVDAVMSELYTYDNLNQLTSFQRGTLNSTKTGLTGSASRSQSWSPDSLGNFTGVTTNGTTQTRTANQQNEYTSISGSGTITYDANGNITADGSGNTYVYDAWNQLVAVKNGSTTVASYGYDGLGRRITETHGSTITDLYYSANWQVLEERVNGQLQARYVWSPAGVDTLVLRDDSSQNNGILDRRLYVQQDILGNVTALIDTNGNVVERYDYDPFGAVTVLNPDFSVRGTSSYNWNYFFQGKRFDGTVGLYDSRGRVYSPTLMRPLQLDPLGQGPDVNPYRWEGNGPTDTLDPTGLAPQSDREREQMVKRKSLLARRLAYLEGAAARFVKDIESKGSNASEADRKLAAQLKAELKAVKAEYDALSKELGSETREQQEAIDRVRRRAQADWDITSKYAEQNIERTKKEREEWRQFKVWTAINIVSGLAAEWIGVLSAGRAAVLAKTPCPSTRVLATGGAARALGRNWQTASLRKAVERHAGPNYTSWTTSTGKRIFENPATGRQVVVDLEGGYFRIFQPTKIGGDKGTYLNLMGKEVTPARIMSNGSVGNPLLRDVDKGLWQQETHFFIEELSR